MLYRASRTKRIIMIRIGQEIASTCSTHPVTHGLADLARATVELPMQDGVVVEITLLEQDNGGPHRAAAYRAREHLRGPPSGLPSGPKSPPEAGSSVSMRTTYRPKRPHC